MPIEVEGDISTVDFIDGFRYAFDQRGQFEVAGGVATRGEQGTHNWFRLEVVSVVFGDLDTDGEDEAAVHMNLEIGMSSLQRTVQGFDISDGVLHHTGDIWNRVDPRDDDSFEIAGLDIANGYLTIVTTSPATEYGSAGANRDRHSLTRMIERTATQRYVELDGAEEGVVVDFTPTETTVVVGFSAAVTRPQLTFHAEAGDFVRLDRVLADSPSLRLRNAAGDDIATVSPGALVMLLTSGSYTAEFLESGPATIADRSHTIVELAVAKRTYFETPQWHPRTSQIAGNGYVLSASWPEFVSELAETDTTLLNQAVRDIVADQQQAFLAGLPVADEATTTASNRAPSYFHTVKFTVTLTAPKLVSLVLFSGQPAPEGYTIDLATGRQLTLDDIFIDSDPELLRSLWLDAFVNSARCGPAPAVPDDIVIDSARLGSKGVVLVPAARDDMSSWLGGAYISYDAFIGMVDPDLMSAAQDGAGVTLAVEQITAIC